METQTQIYFTDGKAFLRILDDSLFCIICMGDEGFIRSLDKTELWQLTNSTMLEIKYGRKSLAEVICTTPLTVH